MITKLNILIFFYIIYLWSVGTILPLILNKLFNNICFRLIYILIILYVFNYDEISSLLLMLAYYLSMRNIRNNTELFIMNYYDTDNQLPIPKGYGYSQIPSNILREKTHLTHFDNFIFNDKIYF